MHHWIFLKFCREVEEKVVHNLTEGIFQKMSEATGIGKMVKRYVLFRNCTGRKSGVAAVWRVWGLGFRGKRVWGSGEKVEGWRYL